MKIADTGFRIVVVCMFAVLGYISLRRSVAGPDRKAALTAAEAELANWKVPMPHGPLKEGLAAFLICQREQFKIGELIPVMIGIVAGPQVRRDMAFQPPDVPLKNRSWFSIVGPDGKDIPQTGSPYTDAWAPLLTSEHAIWLSRSRFSGIALSDGLKGYELNTPGLYTIKYHYNIPDVPDGPWWQGHLVSNEIQIEIVP